MAQENKPDMGNGAEQAFIGTVAKNVGKARFSDTVTVKATKNHPTKSAGVEYKVHTGHVAYLVAKGYIEKPVEKS